MLSLHPDRRLPRTRCISSTGRSTCASVSGLVPQPDALLRPTPANGGKDPAYFTSPKVPERVHGMNPPSGCCLSCGTRRSACYPTTPKCSTTTCRSAALPVHRGVPGARRPPLCGLQGSQPCLYHLHMENWLRFFPLRRSIVDGDRLIRDPSPRSRRWSGSRGCRRRSTPPISTLTKPRGSTA